MKEKNYILKLSEVGLNDIPLVGGKNASLGEMLQNLSSLGIQIPNGFVITVYAYRKFIEFNKLDEQIRSHIKSIDVNNVESLRRGGLQIRHLIRNSKFPHELSDEIITAYYKLSGEYGQDVTDVAVRSSATAEDLPDASFAGQQETYLNVRGPAALIDAVRNCFASLFTDRAISYRETFQYNHFDVELSICVQKMVRSDLGVSGVAFSLDTETGFKDAVVINATYGLGELLVQGAISPDEFIVFKPLLKQGYPAIIEKKLGAKDKMMVYGENPDERVRIIPTEKSTQRGFCLSDKEIVKLASWVCVIEGYYSNIRKQWCPMDVEWAIDGITKELFIVQARPETIHSRKDQNVGTQYSIEQPNRQSLALIKGIAVGEKIACGNVNIMYSLDKRVADAHEFKIGDVLVTDVTDPDWEPIMKMASAIVTNKGGRTCHAAIVARELGVPAILGCGNATEVLSNGQTVTVSCAEGETGIVYDGPIAFKEVKINFNELPATKTPIMLNVASPEKAFSFAHYPHAGVGLAREEFIINNYIKVHPLALLKHQTLNDEVLSNKINELIRGYKDGETYFIEKLSYGIAKIAAAFYPQKVIVRFSDFKSNEYFNLLGGKYFEPEEENPMIGWRGASRYYANSYKEAFGLECRAISKVRNELGLNNVTVMIPFCRTLDELQKVFATMGDFGLKRGVNGLEVYLMAEVPTNVILADEFAKHIDGFSIGSNDLTQLLLGIDRDSSLVAHVYDERNDAVKAMIRLVIAAAKKAKVKVGICGQGPSDFPDFAQFLVGLNIDSISVTPDSFMKTIKAIHEIETKMKEDSLVFIP